MHHYKLIQKMNPFINVIKSIFLGSQVFRLLSHDSGCLMSLLWNVLSEGFNFPMLKLRKVWTFFLGGGWYFKIKSFYFRNRGALLDFIVHFIASPARRVETLFWLNLIQWEGSVPLWSVKVHKKSTSPCCGVLHHIPCSGVKNVKER